VHGVGGILGALLTGVFASPSLAGSCLRLRGNKVGADYSIGNQVWVQFQAVLTTVVWSGVVAFLAYKIVDLVLACASPKRKSAKAWTSARTAKPPTTADPCTRGGPAAAALITQEVSASLLGCSARSAHAPRPLFWPAYSGTIALRRQAKP